MRLYLTFALLAACTTGSIETEPGDDDPPGNEPPGNEPPGNEPRTVDIEGPAVLPHVQAFANAACTALDSCTISTYEGHSPTASRALDNLVSDVYGKVPTDDNALGDALAAWALEHQEEFAITYVIWRQRYNDGRGWDPMEDRGSITQNHYDHVHVSFEAEGP